MPQGESETLNCPLLEAMLRYKKEAVYPLHTPGHKGGRGMYGLLASELGSGVVMDVSLMSELDDIHAPVSCIREAQQLAAACYGSDRCFWSVNGTTEAVQAMLLIALNPGEKLLLPRNAHRSVAGGMILGGIRPVYLDVPLDPVFGLKLQPQPEAVEAALKNDSGIRAVLLTSPNYYGVAAQVREIAAICHAHEAVLLVDEAHGSHLGFSSLLPPSSLSCGADACAQSTHKLLGAMTQCSMLHVQGARLDLDRAASVMSMLTTTSPNYLMLASLDAARAQLASQGQKMAEAACYAARKLRELLKSFAGLRVLSKADLGGLELDMTKVTVNFAAWGYTGVEAGELLRKAKVAVELVDATNVLFLVTYADLNADYELALARIAKVLRTMEQNKRVPLVLPRPKPCPASVPAALPRDVFYARKKAVALEESCGRVCAEQVSFYPPGIPVLLPGEIITQAIIDYCLRMLDLKLPVSGPVDSSLKSIRVVDL